MHHTKMDGRKINVEPTVGGGGKGSNRMEKLEKKRQLFKEVQKKRIKKMGEAAKKEAGKGKGKGKDGAKGTAGKGKGASGGQGKKGAGGGEK